MTFMVNFREEDKRTIFVCNKDYLSKIRNLERDLHKEELSRESKSAIKKYIEEEASNLLRRIGNDLQTGTFFDSDNIKYACYRNSVDGIDLFLKDTILKRESGYQLGLSPEVNMRLIRENGEEVSLHLVFDGVVNQIIMRDLMQIYSALAGNYAISDFRTRGTPMLAINPVQYGPQFVKDANRIYKKLQEHEKGDELHHSRRFGEEEGEVSNVAKGVYAKKLLEFLGVNL